MKAYFWTCNFILMIYIFILMLIPRSFDFCSFVVNFKIGKCDSNFVLFQDWFALFGVSWNFMCIWEAAFPFFFFFFKKSHWDYIGSIDYFGEYAIFIILNLPIREYKVFFHYLVFLISLSSVLGCSVYMSYICLIKFIPKYFIHLDVMANKIFLKNFLLGLLIASVNTMWRFFVLILYPAILVNSFISSSR